VVVQAILQIQGQGSTPFDANNQNLIINAFASVMTTVSRADFTIPYFTSDDSEISDFVPQAGPTFLHTSRTGPLWVHRSARLEARRYVYQRAAAHPNGLGGGGGEGVQQRGCLQPTCIPFHDELLILDLPPEQGRSN